jgi:hypothetical protein
VRQEFCHTRLSVLYVERGELERDTQVQESAAAQGIAGARPSHCWRLRMLWRAGPYVPIDPFTSCTTYYKLHASSWIGKARGNK